MPESLHAMNLLGIGLYSMPEAARLLHLSSAKMRRWLSGYSYVHDGERRHSPALWEPQLPLADGKLIGIGFRDLMELRIVHALINAGVSLQAVRRGLEIARAEIQDDRPLSTARLRTDGVSWFLQVGEETGEPSLIDLVKRRGQYGFHGVIAPSLRDVDFEGIEPSRWWPMGRSSGIVIDPRRRFGAPIIDGAGVSTSALAKAARVEGSDELAARYFEVPVRAVRAAVAFEERIAA